MKKIITLSIASLGILFLAGCNSRQTNQSQPAISTPAEPSQTQPAMQTTKATTMLELEIKESDYCYNTKMGTIIYNGTVDKSCICEGELITLYNSSDSKNKNLIYTECPPNMSCDSSTVYCRGKITGYKNKE